MLSNFFVVGIKNILLQNVFSRLRREITKMPLPFQENTLVNTAERKKAGRKIFDSKDKT